MNVSGVLAIFSVIRRPSAILPALIVSDISCIDWKCLKRTGYTGVILDKDNCLTEPLKDELMPALQSSFTSLVQEFGIRNVLLVSNSAGTRDDPAFIQADSVSRSLGIPVLIHAAKKPSRQCAILAGRFFSEQPPPCVSPAPLTRSPLQHTAPKLLVVGDRVMTDMLLASRLNADGVLTTRSGGHEGLAARSLRILELCICRLMNRVLSHRSKPPLATCLLRSTFSSPLPAPWWQIPPRKELWVPHWPSIMRRNRF